MAGWGRAAMEHLRAPSRYRHLVWELRNFLGNMKRCSRAASLAAKDIYDVGQPSAETHPHLLATGEIMPGISSEEFALRRQKLRERVPAGSLTILMAAAVKQMTSAVPYPYRQDADYLYFTGCQQPGGIAIMDDYSDLCMFMPDRSPDKELWHGRLADQQVAEIVFGADQTYSLKQIPEVLPHMIHRAKSVLIGSSSQTREFRLLPEIQDALQGKKIQDIATYTHKIRWIKSLSEMRHMREVAEITCQAFMQTMLVSRQCPHEHVLAATVEYECKIRGAQRMS